MVCRAGSVRSLHTGLHTAPVGRHEARAAPAADPIPPNSPVRGEPDKKWSVPSC